MHVLLFLVALSGCGNSSSGCIPDGRQLWDDTDAVCCEGLTTTWLAEPGEPVIDQGDYDLPDGCALDPGYLLGGSLCVPCDDGVCDASEDFCTCPEDCPAP